MAAETRPTRASAVSAGQRLLTPSGTAQHVREITVEQDDYGVPALVTATLDDGSTVRMAASSTVRVGVEADTAPATGPVDVIPAEDGTPEAVVAHAAAVHPESPAVQELAARLGKGLNIKSGSNLQDVRDLAHVLFVELLDTDNALMVTSLVTGQDFDGNFARWKWIESCLAMAAYITYENGDFTASEEFTTRLRTIDDVETDPLKAKVAATVRQRQLNEPHLYDREIQRASAAGDDVTEKEWRVLRLYTLMYLRTHGGSETLTPQEIDRRINNELIAIRGIRVD
ncbi:DUF6707 family protein [Arthrobacter roseus]|uniref:DUF6707 family protein n=1 Tax=Arthrobacter roseus TaxID=136274 RepID=UPI001962F0C7|nr:DUF6707 family protein [Arthrobacter roseus]MBM7847550.1 hypothetical protein [Arthrobacter roseus]